MALHDVSKNQVNRLGAMPNAKDLNANRMAHGTTGFTLKQEDSDTTLGKLIIKDGRLLLQTNETTFIDLSNGNMEVSREDGNTLGRLGYRPDDATGAVDIAKPGSNL